MKVNTRKGKILRSVFVILFLGLSLFFTGRYLLYIQIKKTIEKELSSLSRQGIYVAYENLEVDPWAGGLEVYNLTVKVRKDTIPLHGSEHGLEATLPFVQLTGIEVIPFLRNKTLAISDISSHRTYITYTLQATLFKNVNHIKRKIEVKNVSVGKVSLPDIDIYLTDLRSHDTVAHILTDVNMSKLFLAKQLDSLTWKRGAVDISDFAMNYRKEYYGISIKNIHLNISDKSLDIDSLFVKPSLGRLAFMKAKGKQSNFMEAVIPGLKIRSIDWYTFPTATLQIDRVDLRLITSMYRDKRFPFEQREERPLPSHFLHRLPVRLKVDTIRLHDSFVSYEEMPEHGDSTGVVFFKDLNATILNMHNDRNVKVDSRMHAVAKFMGAGHLDVHFTFPHDTLHPYRVAGTLSDMPLMKINKMLGSAALVKIESGVMRNMKFNFTYNKLKSQGAVELNDHNLKILTLRENKKNEQSVSVVKTLLLNTFLINNLDEQAKTDGRKGEINFYRDTQRSVLNYWWKSILSGIKSAYNIDKLPLKANRDAKKQKKKRKTLKEAWSKIFTKDSDKEKESKKED